MGDGMVHGVRLRDGKIEWYRNRWIRTLTVATALSEPTCQRRHRAGLELIGANTNASEFCPARVEPTISGLEPCYVFHPLDAYDEDDTIVLDSATLDTIAAVHLPERVPSGFRGNWAPSQRGRGAR